MPRPADPEYYLITGSGTFFGRNHPFWQSDAPVKRSPRSLATHQPYCKVDFPKLGIAALEYIVGFFDKVYQLHGSESIVLLALMLVGLKFMVGALLLAALFSAAYEKIHFGSSDDAMLDVALLTSAIATVASALPGLTHGGELLLSVIGELMLCVIASALAIYGRGFLVKEELPPPTRSEPVVIQVR